MLGQGLNVVLGILKGFVEALSSLFSEPTEGDDMSLKLRKIKGYLEIHGKQCTEELNKKLGTQLSYEFDWGCIPDNIPEWNWSEPDLKRCFYNSYFLPIEQCLEQLFGDPL